MAYNKRKYRSRSRARPTASGGELGRQLSVYKNPFSTATTNAKIPDGKSMISSGFRHQESFQINESGTSGLTIYMYPGLGRGIVVGPGGVDTRPESTRVYENGVIYDGGQQTSDWVTQWRLVSQGLKLSLVNSDDTNDGWWEAVRMHVPASPGEFAIDNVTSIPTPGMDFPYLNTGNLANNPTYVSGSLKDIHKHLFVLAPASREHEFLRLEKVERTSKDPGDSISQVVDDSHDCIIIKIYGNVGTETNSRLHAHHVCNQEYIYGHDTKQHQQQTQSFDNPTALRTAHRWKKSKLFRAAVAAAVIAAGIYRKPIRRKGRRMYGKARGLY